MAPHTSLATLPDDELLQEVERVVRNERGATAAVVRSLMELDARRLYLREGCSSLFTYCTQVLRLEEGAAYNRIEVARAGRRFPAVLDDLETGAVTLSAIRLLAPHLTEDNHREVLATARHKSKREVERLVATLRPTPDVPAVIRKLPVANGAAVPTGRDVPAPTGRSAETAAFPQRAATQPAVAPTPPAPVEARPRPAVSALAPDRYRIQLTISSETHETLRRVQDLLRHSIPNGDLSAIFDRALTVLLDDLQRRRLAATPSPRPSPGRRSASRHVPAAVRRQVWARDQGQCAFVGPRGRCTERAFLEFHHLEPHAVGGVATVTNIQLRCRAHNAYEAALFFGADAVREAAVVY